MKKTFLLAAIALLTATIANAQPKLEHGTFYVGAKATGLDFSFSDNARFSAAVSGGFFIADNVTLGASAGFHYADSTTSVRALATSRYYFLEKNSGVFFGELGLGIDKHQSMDVAFVMDLMGGYSLFLNEYIALEPSAGFEIPFTKGYDAVFKINLGFTLYF